MFKKKNTTELFILEKTLKESKELGRPVRYKVPILDDYYYKIVWYKFRKEVYKCKLYPAKKVRELIKTIQNAN